MDKKLKDLCEEYKIYPTECVEERLYSHIKGTDLIQKIQTFLKENNIEECDIRIACEYDESVIALEAYVDKAEQEILNEIEVSKRNKELRLQRLRKELAELEKE